MLRARRTAKGYSLRKFAEMVNVSPTYLSLVETGKAEYSPSADRIQAMAEALGESADHWIALAGRVPDDLSKIIQSEPEAMPELLRAANGLSAEQLRRFAKSMEKKRDAEEKK